jgi:hypothetical protein
LTGWIAKDAEKPSRKLIFFDGMDKFRGVVILWHFIPPARPIRHHEIKNLGYG